jgi:predicted dehydrogenase
MKQLRAGILGVGCIAHKHARAMQQLPEQVALVACCGRDEMKTRALFFQKSLCRPPRPCAFIP